jgi:hypothetical protein
VVGARRPPALFFSASRVGRPIRIVQWTREEDRNDEQRIVDSEGWNMRRAIGVLIVGFVIAALPLRANAQAVVANVATPYRMNGFLAAPGYYGMAYGSPSFGMPRTYTAFNSPFGPGYGYGYAPYGLLPGRYGVGLWRPGFVAPGYAYGASYYSTFAVPYSANYTGPLPPVGLYAPGFGPPSFYGW